MKNIIIAVLFCLSGSCFAQSCINPPSLGTFGSDGISWADTVFHTNLNFFNRSWNWGADGSKLDTILHINSYHHGASVVQNTDLCFGMPFLVYPLGLLTGEYGRPGQFNTEAICFDRLIHNILK